MSRKDARLHRWQRQREWVERSLDQSSDGDVGSDAWCARLSQRSPVEFGSQMSCDTIRAHVFAIRSFRSRPAGGAR